MIRVVVCSKNISDITYLNPLRLDRPIESLQGPGIVSINQQITSGSVDKICVRVAVFDEGEHSEDYSRGTTTTLIIPIIV